MKVGNKPKILRNVKYRYTKNPHKTCGTASCTSRYTTEKTEKVSVSFCMFRTVLWPASNCLMISPIGLPATFNRTSQQGNTVDLEWSDCKQKTWDYDSGTRGECSYLTRQIS